MGMFDRFFAKPDPHLMHNGMSDDARRSPEKRKAFLRNFADNAKNLRDSLGDDIKHKRTASINDAIADQYVAHALYSIYFHKSEDIDCNDATLDRKTVESMASYLHKDIDRHNEFYLNSVIPRLKKERCLTEIAPSLFTDSFWDAVEKKRAEQRADAEAVKNGKAYVTAEGLSTFGPKKNVYEASSLQEAYEKVWKGFHIESRWTIVCYGYDTKGRHVKVFTVSTDWNNDLGDFHFHTDWRPKPRDSVSSGHLRMR